MKGHIRPRGKGKGKWSVVLYQGRDINGKTKYSWHRVDGTKRDAERELTRLLHEMNTGTYIEPTKLTVAQYLEQWISNHAEVNLAGTTSERYRSIVQLHLVPKLGKHLLTKLQPIHINEYYAEAQKNGRIDGNGGLSGRTVLQTHRILRKALQDALRLGLISRNPADAVGTPRFERKETKVLNCEELAIVIRAAENSPYYPAILLALGGGLRRGEALAVRWSDLDLEEGIIAVQRSIEQTSKGLRFKSPKSGRPRKLVLPQIVMDGLKIHKENQEGHRLMYGPDYAGNNLVCAKPNGDPVNPDNFSHYFRDFMKNNVKEVTQIRFHDLRHSHASVLGSKGIHPKVVSERLGHSSVNITLDLYTHFLPSMQEEAAHKFDEALSTAPPPNQESH